MHIKISKLNINETKEKNLHGKVDHIRLSQMETLFERIRVRGHYVMTMLDSVKKTKKELDKLKSKLNSIKRKRSESVGKDDK